jgi:hypothetical protein
LSLLWKLNRLRVMSPPEVAFRVRRAAGTLLERAGVGLAHPGEPRGQAGPPWIPVTPSSFDRACYVEAAERILRGEFDVLALRGAALGFPPDWNRDPKSGLESPMAFGKSIDYRRSADVGDIKYLWEVNRHLELVTLAQAWHLTRQSRYAEGCRTLLDSWFQACPYPRGVNWTSSLEHGIRLVNWSFAWQLLGGDTGPLFEEDAGQRFKRRWLESVYQHCHFVDGYLSLHSSANNHLLGELAGLFVASCTWPLWPESRGWRDESARRFEAECLRQNHEDGVNREQAIWYQASVMEMMVVAALVARACGIPFGGAFHQRLGTMAEFIESIADVSGNVPAFGDADDGELLRLDPRRPGRRYATLCAAASLLTGRRGRDDLPVDDSVRWLFGDSLPWPDPQPAAPRSPRRSFPQGGYYVLGGDLGTLREVRIVADAGPLGYLAIAAHGHADCLSFTLSVGGAPVLVDPGTYAYHVGAHWRDFFRGTAAHNTLRVDGLDQSVPGGAFLWVRHARASVETFESSSNGDLLVATHDGYTRLPDPVLHRRRLAYSHASRRLVVEDELRCAGSHCVELFWHFAAGSVLECVAGTARASCGAASASVSVPAGLTARVVEGDEALPQGWVSGGLDLRERAATLVCAGEIRGNTTFRSVIEVG